MFWVPPPAVACDWRRLPIRFLARPKSGISVTLTMASPMPTQLACASLPVTRWWIAVTMMYGASRKNVMATIFGGHPHETQPGDELDARDKGSALVMCECEACVNHWTSISMNLDANNLHRC